MPFLCLGALQRTSRRTTVEGLGNHVPVWLRALYSESATPIATVAGRLTSIMRTSMSTLAALDHSLLSSDQGLLAVKFAWITLRHRSRHSEECQLHCGLVLDRRVRVSRCPTHGWASCPSPSQLRPNQA